jgi:phosphoribosylformimino-5-aminoimidazole carboxamide ribotide isomerase
MDRLQAVLQAIGNDKTKLVIDLSCRRKDDKWFVATNKWQTITEFELNQGIHTQCLSSCPTDVANIHA